MKLKRWIAWGLVSAALIFFVGLCTAWAERVSLPEGAPIVSYLGDKGKINWGSGYIEAVGRGTVPKRYLGKPHARPIALRAAKMDAYRNLMEVVTSIQVSSETTVKDCLVGNNSVRAQVEGLVKESTVVNSEYDPAGTVHVTLRMPLYGEFSRVMLSKIPEKKKIGQSTAEMLTEELSGASPVNRPSVAFTGLVIDVRGLQARPAMSPKILDENGNEIYGAKIAERDIALSKGMTGYTSDLTAARSHPRVTDNPLGVKGLRTEGSGAADIVVSNADAQAIRTADNLSFLKKCRVMIVLDEKE